MSRPRKSQDIWRIVGISLVTTILGNILCSQPSRRIMAETLRFIANLIGPDGM